MDEQNVELESVKAKISEYEIISEDLLMVKWYFWRYQFLKSEAETNNIPLKFEDSVKVIIDDLEMKLESVRLDFAESDLSNDPSGEYTEEESLGFKLKAYEALCEQLGRLGLLKRVCDTIEKEIFIVKGQ